MEESTGESWRFSVGNGLVHSMPLLSRVSECALPPATRAVSLPSPPMAISIIGRTTNAVDLKDALDLSTQRTRAIASRVAQASVKGGNGFALPIDPATGQPAASEQVDLEAEMTSLADEQLRYEATEKLLEKAYAQLRTSMREK